MKPDTLKKTLERYREGHLRNKVLARITEAHGARAVKTVQKRLNALDELEEMVVIQRTRVDKMLLMEKDKPILLKSATDEIRLLKEMLVDLGRVQLETGILPKATRRITGTITGADGETAEFSWTEEQEQLYRELERVYADAASRALSTRSRSPAGPWRASAGRGAGSGTTASRSSTRQERFNYLAQAIFWLAHKTTGQEAGRYIEPPVDFRTFVESDELLKKRTVLWPEVIANGAEINSGRYQEVVLTGGIGTAKTTIAIYSMAYQQYVLSRIRDPHGLFDLDPSSEILMVFQSLNKHLAMDVDYRRFRDMIDKAPFFDRVFPYDRSRRGGDPVPEQHRRQAGLGPRHRRDRPERHRRDHRRSQLRRRGRGVEAHARRLGLRPGGREL